MTQRTVEWLNSNKYRRYPFIEDLELKTTSGYIIPDSTILDISGYIYTTDLSSNQLKLISFEVLSGTPIQIQFNFVYADMIPFNIIVPVTADFPYETSSFSSMHYCRVIFGDGILELSKQPVGVYILSNLAIVEPACIIVLNNNRLTSIKSLATGSTMIYDDIYLEEGYNCKLEILKDSNAIRISAIKGAGKGLNCLPPASSGINCNNVLLTINGLRAGSLNDFMILGGPGVDVLVSGNVVNIKGTFDIRNKECG